MRYVANKFYRLPKRHPFVWEIPGQPKRAPRSDGARILGQPSDWSQDIGAAIRLQPGYWVELSQDRPKKIRNESGEKKFELFFVLYGAASKIGRIEILTYLRSPVKI